jgi:uncharacterized protein YndB with AHSA1/START domain
MPDIRHRVRIAAPQERVYQDLTTKDGFTRWWTRTDGAEGTGGKLEFFFGTPEPGLIAEITEQTPGSHIVLHCIEGPAEWVGTDLNFRLSPSDDGGTVVLFSHEGWQEPVEFMYHCSTKWAYFLLGLKGGLEGRQYTPYPDDMKISTWG